MALKVTLEQDIKTALLAGDKSKAEVLKLLKSAILYEEVALKLREQGLSDEQIIMVFAREAKKRTESADLYKNAGDNDRANVEMAEKTIIDAYLPSQLNDDELKKVVDDAMADLGADAQMGQVIGAVRAKVGAGADGARIAAAVKAKLSI